MKNEIVYDFVSDFLYVFFDLFLCSLIIHSLPVRFSPEVVSSQVFPRLRVLKERSTVHVEDDKVKAMLLTIHVEQQNRTYSIESLLFDLTTCF